jgi:hypothetical protein
MVEHQDKPPVRRIGGKERVKVKDSRNTPEQSLY